MKKFFLFFMIFVFVAFLCFFFFFLFTGKPIKSIFNIASGIKPIEKTIQTDENENVELSFDVKDLNGESVSPEGFSGTKTITITPQTLLKLTIKPDVTEIEGGKFGINISINTDVTDENVNIVLPNDIFNNN